MSELILFLAVNHYPVDVGICIGAICVYNTESFHEYHVACLSVIKTIAVGSLPPK